MIFNNLLTLVKLNNSLTLVKLNNSLTLVKLNNLIMFNDPVYFILFNLGLIICLYFLIISCIRYSKRCDESDDENLNLYELNSDEVINNQECSICVESLNDNIAIKLKCNHIFHKKCLEEWLKKSKNKDCPLCRMKVIDI